MMYNNSLEYVAYKGELPKTLIRGWSVPTYLLQLNKMGGRNVRYSLSKSLRDPNEHRNGLKHCEQLSMLNPILI
jgi:hypothetical protein